MNVRKYLLAFLLCGIFFLFPFQVYVIGSGMGIGIEGAVYRFQITSYGDSFIPITSDIKYVADGVYSGRTALSIIIWVSGTIILTLTTLFGLFFIDSARPDYYRQVSLGMVGCCACYLLSCVAQYGYFLSGMAGSSIPAGIFLILFWVILLNYYPGFFSELSR